MQRSSGPAHASADVSATRVDPARQTSAALEHRGVEDDPARLGAPSREAGPRARKIVVLPRLDDPEVAHELDAIAPTELEPRGAHEPCDQRDAGLGAVTVEARERGAKTEVLVEQRGRGLHDSLGGAALRAPE